MKKRDTFVIIIIFILLFTAFFLFSTRLNKVCINGNCFDVELAKTSLEHSRGLMNRESIPLDSGMLFIFEKEDNYSFWMKNTLIALDIIWIDENNEVVSVERDARPCTEDPCIIFFPNTPAKYVLEINAGLSKKFGITEGDKVKFYLG